MPIPSVLSRLRRRTHATAATEYMILIGLLAIVVVGAAMGIGRGTSNTFLDAEQRISSGIATAGTSGTGSGGGSGTTPPPPPPPPPPPTAFTPLTLTAGFNKTCAHGIETTGTQATYCWGRNWIGVGSFGSFDDEDSATPVRTGYTGSLLDFTTTSDYSCAITATGALLCAGAGLPIGAGPTPINYGLASSHRSISMAIWGGHNCFTQSDGSAWCQSPWESAPPFQMRAGGVVQMAGSADYGLCLLINNGTVECAGDETMASEWDLEPKAGLSSIDEIAGGGNVVCARDGGTVWCWGKADYGLLGTGETVNRATPAVVPALAGATDLVESDKVQSMCAMMASGPPKCWGMVPYGPNGAPIQVNIPTDVPNWPGGRLAVGDGYLCAITPSNEIQCMGDAEDGVLGNGQWSGTTDVWTTVVFPPAP